MRKYIKIFGVIIFVYCCLGIFNIAKAETPNDKPPLYETPGLMKKPVPVYCGPTQAMFNTAQNTFNQKPLFGAEIVIPQTGEIVAVVSVFINQDNVSDLSVMMTMLTKDETCVLAYGRNIKYYDEEPTEKAEPKPGYFIPASVYGDVY